MCLLDNSIMKIQIFQFQFNSNDNVIHAYTKCEIRNDTIFISCFAYAMV